MRTRPLDRREVISNLRGFSWTRIAHPSLQMTYGRPKSKSEVFRKGKSALIVLIPYTLPVQFYFQGDGAVGSSVGKNPF